MRVDQAVIGALEPLGLPVAQGRYVGEEDAYCVFLYDTEPVEDGDGAPGGERYLIRVHLYAPIGTDTFAQRQQIKRLLVGAGSTWPSVADATEPNGGTGEEGAHLIFTCETVAGIEEG